MAGSRERKRKRGGINDLSKTEESRPTKCLERHSKMEEYESCTERGKKNEALAWLGIQGEIAEHHAKKI